MGLGFQWSSGSGEATLAKAMIEVDNLTPDRSTTQAGGGGLDSLAKDRRDPTSSVQTLPPQAQRKHDEARAQRISHGRSNNLALEAEDLILHSQATPPLICCVPECQGFVWHVCEVTTVDLTLPKVLHCAPLSCWTTLHSA